MVKTIKNEEQMKAELPIISSKEEEMQFNGNEELKTVAAI